MIRKVKLAAVFAIAALGAGAAAYVEWGKDPDNQLRPDDAAYVLRGKEICRTACASCHGANLEGQPSWRERGSDAWRGSQLYELLVRRPFTPSTVPRTNVKMAL